MAYKQTNTLRPTEDQFKELFDSQANTFWKYNAHSAIPANETYDSVEDMRDKMCAMILEETRFFQMFWEDDYLIGFRQISDAIISKDMHNPAKYKSFPISKILGSDWSEKDKTGRMGFSVGRASNSHAQREWMTMDFCSPLHDNKDGESFHEAMINNNFEQIYGMIHGSVQKKLCFSDIFDKGLFEQDIYLSCSLDKTTGRETGFDLNNEDSVMFRLIGGHHLGWPSFHALYHNDNNVNMNKVPRPYMDTLDSPDKPPVAPIPPGTD